MITAKTNIMIAHEDYDTLLDYVKGIKSFKAFDSQNAAILHEELQRATLVKKDKLPKDVVRLHSKVVIKEMDKDKLVELMLVLPEEADVKEKKVSVFAPIGTALIGFRQGENVEWKVPSGNKTFTIMKVIN